MGVRVKKETIEIEIFLPFRISDPPVFKSVKVSNHRTLHYLTIRDINAINETLSDWIHISYELIVKEGKEI
jgi:hypothetical protein